MKTVELVCAGCKKYFTKVKKEYDRWVRLGRNEFYCNRKCFGKYVSPRNAQTEKAIAWRRSAAWKEWQQKNAERQRNSADPFRVYMKLMKNHKQDVEVDLPYLKELWQQQGGRCVYSDLEMQHPTWVATNSFSTASIDRIDPAQGYIKGNVQFIIRALNWAKNSYTDSDFRKFLEELVEGLTRKLEIAK